jgi:DNA-binding CsgD family transcriptional regulator
VLFLTVKLSITTVELRLLRHAASGAHAQQVASLEGISKKEAESKLKELYRKLQATNAVEALQNLARTDFIVDDVQRP